LSDPQPDSGAVNRSLIGWVTAAVLAVGGAAFAYVFYFAGGSGEPSTDLTTPEVSATTTIAPESATTTGVGATSTTRQPAPTDSEASAAGGAYVIDSTRSTVSFEINEVLRGEPMTVVGATDQVAGQVVVDPGDLGASKFSEIVINARSFATDSSRRDRAIRGPVILDSGSDQHEFITFTPTSIEGLDGMEAIPGQTYDFSVTGDLTIKGTTNPVTFDVTVEMTDESILEGMANTVVLRSDFGIGIPSVPFVADVTDEVTLDMEIVATNG
jgi:polyisoprenoid-binding protein YceI